MKTGKLLDNYILDIDEGILWCTQHEYYIYLIFAIVLSKNFNFEIQKTIDIFDLLLSSYRYNNKIYKLLIDMIPNNLFKEMLNNQEIIEYMKDILENDEYFVIINKEKSFIDMIIDKSKQKWKIYNFIFIKYIL